MTISKPAQRKRTLPYLTKDELDAPIKIIKVGVYGRYTKRNDVTKDVIEAEFEDMVEVPAKYHQGDIKLACNRLVKSIPQGIRALTYNVDRHVEPVKVEGTRKKREFMSSEALIENTRAKEQYRRDLEKKVRARDAMADGILPSFTDDTAYDPETGLPPLKEFNGDQPTVEIPE